MISIRELRFWTTLTVAAISALTMNWALPTLRFAWAAQFADAQKAQERLQPSFAEHPSAPLARKLALVLSNVAPASRADALQSLIEMTPMASGAWLDLAIAREGAAQSLKDVSSALAMSSLTGPNEGRFMAGRAAFGLPLWDQLPPDVRRGLIGDLVGGWSELREKDRQVLGDAMAILSDRSRAEIEAALLLIGASATPIIAALDLSPSKDEDRGDGSPTGGTATDSGAAVAPPTSAGQRPR